MNACRLLAPVLITGSCAALALAQSERIETPAPPPDRLYVNEWMIAGAPPTAMYARDDDADDAQEEGAAWIGLQLGPVPASLASHLGVGEKGLMVRNVYEKSPADQTGIQRYDVIVRADDKDVVGTVEAFSKTIRSRRIGDTIHLTIIRGGKELRQDIVLGEAPPPHELTPKFAEEPDVLYRRNFGLRGRILRPGPDGWVMEDLGELPDVERLLRRFDIRRDREEVTRSPDHARRVGKNGETIDVQRRKDGSIEVRREKRGATGPAEVKVYPNEEVLRQGDPEAADLLSRHAGPRGSDERPEAERRLERRRILPPDERWREWRERFFQGPFERLAPPPPGEAPPVRFEVAPDGRITVHKSAPDAELTMTYNDREEFKRKAPELFRQFQEMEKSLK